MSNSSNFAAKMETIVLFNWFSLKYKTRSRNESSHDHPEITGKQHAKFGADLLKIVAEYWKQINGHLYYLMIYGTGAHVLSPSPSWIGILRRMLILGGRVQACKHNSVFFVTNPNPTNTAATSQCGCSLRMFLVQLCWCLGLLGLMLSFAVASTGNG